MDIFADIDFSICLIVLLITLVVIIVLLVAFSIGYAIGSSKADQFITSLTLLQKDREQRRIIRMQAAPKPKKQSYSGYYPGAQARRNQAKYRRAMKTLERQQRDR